MMKNPILLFLILLFGKVVFAQDTLVFKSGEVINVTVLGIEQKSKLIVYIDKGDTLIGNLDAIENVKLSENDDRPLSTSYKRFSSKAYFGYTERYSFFNKPVKYEYGKLLISTNLTSLDEKSPLNSIIYFSLNRVLTIEPEYFITKKTSIKIPIGIGINRIMPYSDEYYSNWEMYGYSPDEISPPPLNTYYFDDEYYGASYNNDHPMNTIFQVGIYTKHFLNSQKKYRLYFSQGLSYGKANYFAIDYYHQHRYITYYDDYKEWEITDSRTETRDNIVSYFRYEVLAGYNMRIFKSIGFSIETGFSTKVNANGDEYDRVFRKIEDGDYIQIYSNKYTNESQSGKFIIRLLASYNFGTKKIEKGATN